MLPPIMFRSLTKHLTVLLKYLSKWPILWQVHKERHCHQFLHNCHKSCLADNFWMTTYMTNYSECLRRRLLPLTTLKTSFFLSKNSHWDSPNDYFKVTNFWQIKTCFESRRLRHPFFCQKLVTRVFSAVLPVAHRWLPTAAYRIFVKRANVGQPVAFH